MLFLVYDPGSEIRGDAKNDYRSDEMQTQAASEQEHPQPSMSSFIPRSKRETAHLRTGTALPCDIVYFGKSKYETVGSTLNSTTGFLVRVTINSVFHDNCRSDPSE